jgi:hypothetical protein
VDLAYVSYKEPKPYRDQLLASTLDKTMGDTSLQRQLMCAGEQIHSKMPKLRFFYLKRPDQTTQPSTPNPKPQTPNPNPKPQTLNPQPSTLNPQPPLHDIPHNTKAHGDHDARSNGQEMAEGAECYPSHHSTNGKDGDCEGEHEGGPAEVGDVEWEGSDSETYAMGGW